MLAQCPTTGAARAGAAPRAAPRRASCSAARPAARSAGASRLATPARRVRAAAGGAVPQTDKATDVFTAPTFFDPATSTSWHFLIANADFMLNDENNEPFPEVLRERRRFFLENNAAVNFFVVPNPAWLASMPEVAKRVRQPAVALVSPDATWIMCVPTRAAACRAARPRPRSRAARRGAACGGRRSAGCLHAYLATLPARVGTKRARADAPPPRAGT
jgi:hypothetical protein